MTMTDRHLLVPADGLGRIVMKRKKQQKPQPTPPTRPRPELNEASRALLGRDEEKRPYRPRDEDASIEDPLHDWAEADC
jgi:hypothetical protein